MLHDLHASRGDWVADLENMQVTLTPTAFAPEGIEAQTPTRGGFRVKEELFRMQGSEAMAFMA